MSDPSPKALQIELLPCPFCGGEAMIEPKNWAGRDYIGVFCNECLIFQDSRSSTNAEAIAAWNQRFEQSLPVEADDQAGEVERGEEASGLPERLYKLADEIVAGLTVYCDHVHGALIEAADAIIEYRKNLVAALQTRDAVPPPPGSECVYPAGHDARVDVWQDISTAPKDGTVLLLFARCETATASAPVIGWHHPQLGWIELCFAPNNPVGIVPSHWKLRPDFPKGHQ